MKTFCIILFFIILIIWLIWSSVFFMTFSSRVKESVKEKMTEDEVSGAKYQGADGAKRFNEMYRRGQVRFVIIGIVMMILMAALAYYCFFC